MKQSKSGESPPYIADNLYFKAMQLSALLTMIGGEGRERFRFLGDATQANYLWACNDLADEIEELAEKLTHYDVCERKGGQS